MENDELQEILEDHKKWLWDDGGEKANLREANLRYANLRDANLRYANLRDANLRGANLRGANLREANLRYADLRDADLGGANLWGADLRGADLRDANLRYANLRDANLRYANLRDANLRHADLRDADLRRANLRDADLRRANLGGADLGEIFPFHIFTICPAGTLTVYKGCDDHVLKLKIPSDAERVNGIGSRKCRASKAKVLAAYDTDGNEVEKKEFSSNHAEDYTYTVGEMAIPDDYDDDPRVECSHGIHFHLTFEEAKEWA